MISGQALLIAALVAGTYFGGRAVVGGVKHVAHAISARVHPQKTPKIKP